jgi:hypothetical protein
MQVFWGALTGLSYVWNASETEASLRSFQFSILRNSTYSLDRRMMEDNNFLPFQVEKFRWNLASALGPDKHAGKQRASQGIHAKGHTENEELWVKHSIASISE